MEQLIELHGKPQALRLDNGSELTSIAFTEWCQSRSIEPRFIQPGKPDQNAFIERFNKTYRDEVLNAYVFDSIEQVREITDSWLYEYKRGAASRQPRPRAAPHLHAEAKNSRKVQFQPVCLTGEPTRAPAEHPLLDRAPSWLKQEGGADGHLSGIKSF